MSYSWRGYTRYDHPVERNKNLFQCFLSSNLSNKNSSDRNLQMLKNSTLGIWQEFQYEALRHSRQSKHKPVLWKIYKARVVFWSWWKYWYAWDLARGKHPRKVQPWEKLKTFLERRFCVIEYRQNVNRLKLPKNSINCQ